MMGNMSRFHIRPARPDETGLFYTPHPEEDRRRGTIGHVRMDFGRSGNEFWHTWWPRGPEELNSPVFKAELQEVVDTMRENVLKSRFSMERFCYEHGGKIAGGYVQNYGYIVETEHYRYCLRCNPSPGDYNGYYYSANCRTYAYEEHLQCFQELFAAVEQTFKPEANVNMLLHQVFDTMLSFAARVLGGEMPDDDTTTQWAFEQIYSFVVPNVREELLIPSGSTPV